MLLKLHPFAVCRSPNMHSLGIYFSTSLLLVKKTFFDNFVIQYDKGRYLSKVSAFTAD